MRRLTPLALLLCVLANNAFAQFERPLVNSGALISEAIKLHDQGKYKDALAAYKQISRNDTNYVYALYEAALSLHADSQFVEAIRFCEEGLREKGEREREPDLYTQLAISLDNNGNKERALKVFDSALQKYPTYVPLIFNKGITLMKLEKREEALRAFQQALLINPYHASSHFRLAQLAVIQGKPVQAFLGLATYLIMAPSGPMSNQAIAVMSAISTGNEDILGKVRNRQDILPENLQEVENIVFSKIALNKNYKPLLKLDDAISRQLQVICEKLAYDKDEQDFWMQYYVPLYATMLQDKRFETFVNYIFSNVNIESIQKYNKSHKKEIEKFAADIVVYVEGIKTTRELNFSKRKDATVRYLFQGNSIGTGPTAQNGTITVNDWQFNYPAGNKQAVGEFNLKGDKNGVWKYYYFNGQLKGVEHVKDGLADGENIDYFQNGNVSVTGNYKSGKKQGEFKTYFYTGAPNQVLNYKDDELDGTVKRFFSTGGLREEQQYKTGKQEGKFISYHKNGNKQTIAAFVNDLEEGPASGFYANGNKSFEGEYRAGKSYGEWKRYHENGKLHTLEHYNKGELDGEFISYHDNGTLEFKTTYKQGLFTGDITYFDVDGKQNSVFTFDKNNPRSARYYDKTGKEISKSVMQSKVLHLTTYLPNGARVSEKDVTEKGVLNGTLKEYYPNGAIRETTEYVNGTRQGKALTYFINGQKSTEFAYNNGEEDGYYRRYYLNGKVASEGWYQDGALAGDWYFYDELGNLSSKDHYLHGEIEGVSQAWYPTGKLKLEITYHLGWMIDHTQFDTLGNVLVRNNLATGSGDFLVRSPNGKKFQTATIVNGNYQGPKTYYYPDGSVNISHPTLNDAAHGELKAYHINGKPQTEGSYAFGDKQGLWKYYKATGQVYSTEEYLDNELHGKSLNYHKNGKVELESEYKNGERFGIRKKYDPEGQLVYQIRYENDLPVAYTYFDKSGNLVPEIQLPYGTGKLTSFFSNGKPAATLEYINGKLNGKDLQYHSNGQLWMESTEQYGETTGALTAYHPNGKLSHTTNYLNGNQHGSYKFYNEAGIVIEEGYNFNDEQHGDRKVYDDSGKLIRVDTYYFGVLLASKKV